MHKLLFLLFLAPMIAGCAQMTVKECARETIDDLPMRGTYEIGSSVTGYADGPCKPYGWLISQGDGSRNYTEGRPIHLELDSLNEVVVQWTYTLDGTVIAGGYSEIVVEWRKEQEYPSAGYDLRIEVPFTACPTYALVTVDALEAAQPSIVDQLRSESGPHYVWIEDGAGTRIASGEWYAESMRPSKEWNAWCDALEGDHLTIVVDRSSPDSPFHEAPILVNSYVQPRPASARPSELGDPISCCNPAGEDPIRR